MLLPSKLETINIPKKIWKIFGEVAILKLVRHHYARRRLAVEHIKRLKCGIVVTPITYLTQAFRF